MQGDRVGDGVGSRKEGIVIKARGTMSHPCEERRIRANERMGHPYSP